MDDESVTLSNLREPSYADAIIPAITLVVLIVGAVLLFGQDLDGPVQVALILSTLVEALILLKMVTHGTKSQSPRETRFHPSQRRSSSCSRSAH